MALCSLPRTSPGNRTRYVRRNGPYTLVMNAGGLSKLPFGNFPRLLLAWVCTEAVRTQSRELVLGRSLAKFMKTLGVYSCGGREQTRFRNQMKRLFNAHVWRCCMIQLRREWGRFSNFSFRTPQRRISAYPARPSG